MIAHVNGIDLSWDDVGAGVPVVFLHGFPLDRTFWKPQLSALIAQARCIAPDLRGFGDSTPAAPYSMDQYADDVVALLDHLGIDRAVIAGLSMGGYVAFALWRRHRERVRALILADTRATADSAEGLEKRRALLEVARREGSGAVATRQLPTLLGATTRERNPDVAEWLHLMMAMQPVEGVAGAIEAMMARPDSTPDLATITVPTLIVVGEEDTLTPPSDAAAMAGAIRGARLETLTLAGHLAPVERPAAFNHIVAEFVASLVYC